jgi:hypothetical protein
MVLWRVSVSWASEEELEQERHLIDSVNTIKGRMSRREEIRGNGRDWREGQIIVSRSHVKVGR